MPLMSFREFLYLETGQIYPKYKLGDTILPTQPDAELLNHFLNYRSYGTSFLPREDFEARYMAIIDKILNNDIPFFLPSISENNLRVMAGAIIGTLANSSIPRVQVTSLCPTGNRSGKTLSTTLCDGKCRSIENSKSTPMTRSP